MANILSSKLVTLTFSALAHVLSLSVSNCLSTSCAFDHHCHGKYDFCWGKKCCLCPDTGHFGFFDKKEGKCVDTVDRGEVTTRDCGSGSTMTMKTTTTNPTKVTNNFNNVQAPTTRKPLDGSLSNENLKNWASTYGIVIVFSLVVIGGGVAACCFFIFGCPGYKWRKRNEPPAQTNVYPNPAQYPSQPQFPPPNPNGSNVSVASGNGPPQYPYPYQPQPQYQYPNMNPNYGQGQYPNQYAAPPPPPNYGQYPNQYPAPPPFPPPPPK